MSELIDLLDMPTLEAVQEVMRLINRPAKIEVLLAPADSPTAGVAVGTGYAIVVVPNLAINALATSADWTAGATAGTFKNISGRDILVEVISDSTISTSAPNNLLSAQLWVNGAMAPNTTEPSVYFTSASSVGTISFKGTVTVPNNQEIGFAFKASAALNVVFYGTASSAVEKAAI